MVTRYHKTQSQCRRCKHQFSHHCLYTQVFQGEMVQPFIVPIDIVPCDSYHDVTSSPFTPGKCGCVNWEPQDNLEFLELKADEKNKDA